VADLRVLITGLSGTLAPRVAAAARWRGLDVVGWDRRAVDPDDAAAAAHWLDTAGPDAIVHLATGSTGWAGALARYASAHGLPMVFTSTAMVFDHVPDGPHHPHHVRTAKDDYGRSKIAGEDAVLAAHPQACIARIGWQIDATRPGNNMLLHLDQQQQREGCVAASRAWRPACSFMDDTAAALIDLIVRPTAGIVHLDSNADEGHGFDRIVQALKHSFGRDHWQIHVHEDYRHDQRLAGGGRRLPPLSARLAI
jgi:dTDP-4-dehydrorhamnose reductase